MAAHRKPPQRSLSSHTARTAATLALAGAATATGFDGTAHAEPQLTPAQVKAKVETLYQEAEAATEKYNGTKEKADTAQRRLSGFQDEAARRQEKLNSARDALGSVAAAQYRDGGIDPAWQLALSSDPDRYLDGAALAERVGDRQVAAVSRVRRQLREIEQLRGAARIELKTLRSRQAELRRQKKTVTGKLDEARRLLARLTPRQRTEATGAGSTVTRASRSAADPREPLEQAGPAPASTGRAAAAVAYAYSKLGSPYVWGATGPNAFDCSGLAQAAYRAAGISLPRTTYAQINAGRRVSRAELRPGDLVFFYSGISHVGIYVGNGQMIHAPNPSAPVRLAPIDQMPFAGATRVA
ncbi:C40 family peptidase [Streptomyces sp. 5-8]|uniref:C40 family peptidase n=1 Tax=Streptomyces musisoli TaxID=2802280 RepID=A0ABS1P000_9ACTN|nr:MULTISPECIES: C40 family peptidase [Streptomyces]MBL1105691.1 C40 family peptidase [Streptomyces musisoli]MBY8845229.1 C40 family peptidase [Streptomyces sp. SP2-10]